MNWVGEKRFLFAVLLIGFLVGLPIFCDSGFIILSGIVLSLQKSTNKLPYTLALSGALYSVHCLVPPHPGILAAASTLNVNLGTTMLLGTVLSLVPCGIAYWYAAKKMPGLEASSSLNFHENAPVQTQVFIWALLPIVVPIVLMGLKAVAGLIMDDSIVKTTVIFIGEPMFALFLGCMLAYFPDRRSLNLMTLSEEALKKSGPILAIIAMGGVFGEVVKAGIEQANLSQYLQANGGTLWVFIAFGVSAFFKTAQGSSTVAILSATSILQPLLPSLGVHTAFQMQLVLMAMGAGSMALSHANDAYFWVITNFSGLSSKETLRNYSPMTLAMALGTLLVIWALA
jgi:gluconate:H+ symporter, GntP family